MPRSGRLVAQWWRTIEIDPPRERTVGSYPQTYGDETLTDDSARRHWLGIRQSRTRNFFRDTQVALPVTSLAEPSRPWSPR
jgi:hypothetical protein